MSHPLDSLWLDVNKPSRMPLMSPTRPRKALVDKDGNPGYIDVYSKDSDANKNYWKSVDERLSPEDRTIGYFVAITAGWHLVGLDGAAIDFPFSPENAKALYSNPGGIDIADQVGEHAAARANFIKASSSN